MTLMTSTTTRMIARLAAAFAICILAMPATGLAQTRDELKSRFKQRDPELSKLKADGKIGETWQGFVEVVKKDESLSGGAKELMEEENSDRRSLYAIIARDPKTERTAAAVGVNNGLRNFADAKPQEYLKAKDGPWVQRGDVAKLKRQGKLGETWEGYVDAVKPKDLEDAKIAAVIVVENSARKYAYQKQARQRESTEDQEAQRAGQANLASARAGEYIKDKDGKWVKKSER